jgi:hypothetical protein
VSAYTRSGHFKIGITNNPQARFSKGYSDYDEMIVLYKSSSIESVSQVERDLIAHNQEIAKNVIGGGGGGIIEKAHPKRWAFFADAAPSNRIRRAQGPNARPSR